VRVWTVLFWFRITASKHGSYVDLDAEVRPQRELLGSVSKLRKPAARTVAGCTERDNEHSDSVRGDEFVDLLNEM
jgi:hypothetical protein